jgi:hypothetical protein
MLEGNLRYRAWKRYDSESCLNNDIHMKNLKIEGIDNSKINAN